MLVTTRPPFLFKWQLPHILTDARPCRSIHRLSRAFPFSHRRPLTTMCPAISDDTGDQKRNGFGHGYEEAIGSLNRLQSNASVLEQAKRIRASDPSRNLTHTRHYLNLIGITDRDLADLKAIHVAGTKGKGSTCVFTESILRQYGVRTGLYSSPHLIEARERIRMHGQPLSRHLFSHYFWKTYDAIRSKSDQSTALGIPALPTYFMFLTVMAVNVFVTEQVDAAIFEVGIGGEYDCTNFLKDLTAVGITSLALDHVELLGTTIPQIAWQKSGIMKANVPAFTVHQQEPAAMHVLQKRAVEKECQLVVVPADLAEYRLSPSDPADPLRPSVPQSQGDRGTVALGIPGEVQQMNASLAVQLSHCWLKKHSLLWQERKKGAAEEDETGVLRVLPQEFADGLAVCRWPGRYQKLCTRLGERQSEKECCGRAQEGDPIHFFLDGAHTKESINLAIEWYYKSSSASPSSQSSSLPLTATRGFASSSSFLVNRILLFNCTGYRNPIDLLAPFLSRDHFDAVLFSPNKLLKDKKVGSDQSNFTIDPESEEKKAVELKNIWIRLKDAKEADVTGPDHSSRWTTAAPRHQIVHSFTCLTEAVDWVQQFARTHENDTHVLVTGSLHLVGGVLGLIDPDGQCFKSEERA